MTDITELAQREKFEAWVMTQICISKSTMEGLRTADGYRNATLSGTDYNRMWNCWKAAGAELVEALEKAENTAGVAGMAESYETTISMLKSRIAELEESHAQVIQSRDHYKRMTGEGLKQLAESRTVKLPVGYTASSGHPFNEAERTVMIPGGGDWLNRFDVEHVLTAAGIKWEAE